MAGLCMQNREQALEWLSRASSSLAQARSGRISDEILFEDLCFNAQQAAEKALKAVCIYLEAEFPKTHSIGFLLEILRERNIVISPEVAEGKVLTEYAVETRYPGAYDPIAEEEYSQALRLAENIVAWAKQQIGPC